MANPSSSSSSDALELMDEEPIVFWGPPGQLRGTIQVRNRSDEKVKLRSLSLEASRVSGPAREPAIVSLMVRLPPNSEAKLAGVLMLDPRTRAGEYDGYVTLGARRQRVRLLVTEHVDLRVHPGRIFIQTEGELEFEREFVFENAGNVPVALGGECQVPLVDTLETRTALRHGLERACKDDRTKDDDHDDVLKAVLCAWSDQQTGPVSIRREPVTLEAGEIRPVRVTFVLPTDIRGLRKYRMDLVVYTAAIRVEVVTGRIGGAVASSLMTATTP